MHQSTWHDHYSHRERAIVSKTLEQNADRIMFDLYLGLLHIRTYKQGECACSQTPFSPVKLWMIVWSYFKYFNHPSRPEVTVSPGYFMQCRVSSTGGHYSTMYGISKWPHRNILLYHSADVNQKTLVITISYWNPYVKCKLQMNRWKWNYRSDLSHGERCWSKKYTLEHVTDTAFGGSCAPADIYDLPWDLPLHVVVSYT